MVTQTSLKSQDVIVSLKIALSFSNGFTYALAGKSLGLAPSRVHASVKMLLAARLAAGNTKEGIGVNKSRLIELLVHGVPYFFPPIIEGLARGMPTALALNEIKQQFSARDDATYVWPDPEGKDRGTSLTPLHPCALVAARNDRNVYQALMAIDALRIGNAREREIATNFLRRTLR